MSIHDRRLKTEIDNIIKSNLEKGYVPTSEEVITEISKYIASNDLLSPAYKYKKTKDLTAADLNRAKQQARQDLLTVYGSLVELYELSQEQITKFDAEKKKYDYKLSSLEGQLMALVSRYSTSGYVASYRDNFSDMNEVDLSKTNAEVNITHQEVTLKKLNDIPYKDFNIEVSPADNKVLTSNGPLSSFLEKDGIVWQGIVESTEQKTTGIDILIDVGSVKDINKAEFEFQMLKPCSIKIATSIDGDKWIAEGTGTVEDKYAVNFSSQLRYIKISLRKEEADKYLLNKYLYYYIIDSIRLSTVNYTMEAQLISKPISAGTNINKVYLSTDSITPPSTNIEYYIAADSATPEWIPISDQEVSFNTVEVGQRMEITLPAAVSNDAYELKRLSVNGQRLFAIAEIDDKEITGYSLYKGINSWRVDSVPVAVTGAQTQRVFLDNKRNTTTSYTSIVLEKPGLILNSRAFSSNSVNKYMTNIYRSSGKTVVKAVPVSTHPITIYLNGSIVFSGMTNGTTVTYPFDKGQNVLEVIVAVDNATPVSVDLNLDILSLGSLVCGNKEPMRAVSLFNLRYNTNNQYDAYTLYKIDNKYMVIVKDPDLAIKYQLVYDYVSEPVDGILFKAVLNREQASVNTTPKLLHYELRFA